MEILAKVFRRSNKYLVYEVLNVGLKTNLSSSSVKLFIETSERIVHGGPVLSRLFRSILTVLIDLGYLISINHG